MLEQLKYTDFSSDGPQFSIHSFQALAIQYAIKNCTAVLLEKNCTEEEYKNTLCMAIKENNVLILSCEQINEMPHSNEGKSTHWVLGFGYWCDENNDYKVAVVHHGIYCKWSIHDLYECNKQLPEKNPYVYNQENKSHDSFEHLNEFRFSLFKIPVNYERKILECSNSNKIR